MMTESQCACTCNKIHSFITKRIVDYTMRYEIYAAAAKATTRISNFEDAIGTSTNNHYNVKYPFSELEIGQCFSVSSDETTEMSLRHHACQVGKKMGKKFCVMKLKISLVNFCFEVARIA